MGKSTLTAGWVRNFAKYGEGLYVPTETPGKVAMHKMALDMAGVPFKLAMTGQLTPQQAEAASTAYAELIATAYNIKVFDDSAPTMDAIYAKIMQMKAGRGCEWLVIDSGSKFAKSLSVAAAGDNLYKATTMASGFMQDMARLGIAVIATWQVGRNMKDRSSRTGAGLEPTLHDAKESGSIEEDCDVLFGLYRHEYYVNRKMADPDELKYPKGTAKILLLKDRAGCDGNENAQLDFEGGKGFVDGSSRRGNINDHLDAMINKRPATRATAPHYGMEDDDDL
jgi:replicative DNA helicase